MDFNYFDLVVAAILLIFSIKGMLRGFVEEVFSLVGLVGSVVVAYHYYPLVASYLTFLDNEIWRNVAAYVIIFALGMIIMGIFVSVLQNIITLSFVAWLDKILGFGFGLCKGVLFCAIAVIVGQVFLTNSEIINNSFSMPYLGKVVEYIRIHIPQDVFNLFSAKG